MRRRAFLKILPAMAAASTWTRAPRWKINPAWVNAPYEAEFLFWKDFGQCVFTAGNAYKGIRFGIDPHPLRIKL